MRLQNSLGRMEENYNPDFQNGYLAVGRVLKAHQKSGTLDVILVNSGDVYASPESQEGKFSARVLQNTTNWDEDRGKYWGGMSPYSEGALVLVAFLNNMKERPVVIGSFPSPYETKNVLPTVYPLNPKNPGFERREALKTLKVYPSMAWKKIDGESNVEFAHASKSFFAMYNTATDSQNALNDEHNGFDYQFLSEVDKNTGEVLETDFENAQSPPKILFVHRSSFNDPTTWTKFFIDQYGTFRLTRDNNDGTLTYSEWSKDGTIKHRRQLDSPIRGEGENYSETSQNSDGSTVIRRILNGVESTVIIDAEGTVSLSQGESTLQLIKDGTITLEASNGLNSQTLLNFIAQKILVVSDKEPENPIENLLWIDTSE